MKCPDCGEEKAPEQFPRNSKSKRGRHTYCKSCHNARNRETVKRLYGNSRHYHLKQRFGVGEAEVAAMIETQGGLCVICQVGEATQVDHDHSTGRVRGVLCLECNAGLGAFRDDPRLVWCAVDYLHPVPAKEWAS